MLANARNSVELQLVGLNVVKDKRHKEKVLLQKVFVHVSLQPLCQPQKRQLFVNV